MPIAKFEMPDGKIARIEFPEGTTPEQAQAEFDSMLQAGEIPMPEPEGPSVLGEIGRVAATGLGEGVSAVPQMVVQGAEAIAPTGQISGRAAGLGLSGEVPQGPGDPAFAQQVQDIRQQVKPQTSIGQSAANVLASGVSAVTTGGFGPGVLGGGLAAGAGGELAAGLFGDTPLTRTGGALAAGGAYGLGTGLASTLSQAGRNMGKRRELADILMRDVTDEKALQASMLQQQAREQGVKLTAGNVLGDKGVQRFEQWASGLEQGAPLATTFREQPKQVLSMVEKQLGKVKGKVLPEDDLAIAGQKAATKVRAKLFQERTAAVEPYFKGEIDEDFAKQIGQFLKGRAKKFAEKGQKRAALEDLRSSLTRTVKQVDDQGKEVLVEVPETNINKINELLREVRTDKVTGQPFPQEVMREVNRTVREVQKGLSSYSKQYEKGNELYRQISQERVNPVTEGIVGRMAGPSGYVPGQQPTAEQLIPLFEKGVTGRGRSPILKAQKDLALAGDEGKNVFNNAVKTKLAQDLAKAVEFEAGDPSIKTVRRLAQDFVWNRSKAGTLRDMLAGVARNKGMPEDELVKGTEVWLRTLNSAAKSPSNYGLSASELAETAGTALGKLNAITAFTPVRMPAKWLDNYLKRDAIGYVSQMLDSPGGIETLRQMAKTAPRSAKANALLGAFHSSIIQAGLVEE